MIRIKKSLADLLPREYLAAVVEAYQSLRGGGRETAEQLIHEPVDFFPVEYEDQLKALLPKTGQRIAAGLTETIDGAPTDSFRRATQLGAAPIGSRGWYRAGEDGKLYLTTKSEHYHAALGHDFPGYRLIEKAKKLGIPNATHNNTRGTITRYLEQELIRTANGLDRGGQERLEQILVSREPHVLNRVINLETGSLACEAAIKMMLASFYQSETRQAEPKYQGRIPVFLVMGDQAGGNTANYHGTTLFAQFLRGMWPTLAEAMEKAGLLKVVAVLPNNPEDFAGKIGHYNQGCYKTAGFLHEIILMNYGGIKLDRAYLQDAYKLCRQTDTPVLCDEIQSCMWYPDFYLFRQYDLTPDFVTIGKGFSGGTYPASRLLTTGEMDCLSQFGALVTNGQEELASLAYLITMEMVGANGWEIEANGAYYENSLRELAARYPEMISGIEGLQFLLAIHFQSVETAVGFCRIMTERGVDISAQTYKPDCPPAAITKLPVTADRALIDFFLERTEAALKDLSH
ncbi:MAG TPA: hypothetical protein DD640_04505 [Clostridiales bacterium]|nr:hypothetical protein [Clostridiales bacterium]